MKDGRRISNNIESLSGCIIMARTEHLLQKFLRSVSGFRSVDYGGFDAAKPNYPGRRDKHGEEADDDW